MRALILPFALWAGALQAALPGQSNAEVYSAAAALASITVMVYRLGVWRQEMVNTSTTSAPRSRGTGRSPPSSSGGSSTDSRRWSDSSKRRPSTGLAWSDGKAESMQRSRRWTNRSIGSVHTPDASRRSRQGGRMNDPLPFLYKVVRRCVALLVDGLLIVSTPLAEKNPAKIIAQRAPLVLSMARLVVLAFAVAMLRQIWVRGVGAWPAATLSIAVVLALPISRGTRPGEIAWRGRDAWPGACVRKVWHR